MQPDNGTSNVGYDERSEFLNGNDPFYKPTYTQSNYIDLCKVIDSYGMRQSFNEDESVLKKYITKGFIPIYTSSTYDIRARSGLGSDLIYGYVKIHDEYCYFVIADDPGGSGYGCCGIYKVYYSFSLSRFLEDHSYSNTNKLKRIYEHYTTTK